MILRLGIYYIIITILLSILPANASLSVNPQIVNYSAASGLPSNEVTCITEDEMGMMWFGTSNGLARFDGYEFKIFRSDYLSPSFLKSNSIRFMKKAPDGRLWIVTNKEVAVFDTRTQHIHHIELEHSVLKKVKSLLLARNGDVYLGTAQGLYAYKMGKVVLLYYQMKSLKSYIFTHYMRIEVAGYGWELGSLVFIHIIRKIMRYCFMIQSVKGNRIVLQILKKMVGEEFGFPRGIMVN